MCVCSILFWIVFARALKSLHREKARMKDIPWVRARATTKETELTPSGDNITEDEFAGKVWIMRAHTHTQPRRSQPSRIAQYIWMVNAEAADRNPFLFLRAFGALCSGNLIHILPAKVNFASEIIIIVIMCACVCISDARIPKSFGRVFGLCVGVFVSRFLIKCAKMT